MATDDHPEPLETPTVEHDPPSLPSSPPAKRTKHVEPVHSLTVASILNDAATPTPDGTGPRSHQDRLSPSTMQNLPPLTGLPSQSSGNHNLPSMSFDSPQIPPLQVQLLSSTAKAPTRGSAHAAGYDLYAARASTIPARGKAMIDTDISISCPAGTYGRVAPRSGLASKHSIDTGAGVIDSDYRGPVKVLLFNFGENEFKVEEGDRIAQLIIERIWNPEVVVVEKLEETVRGAGGFGSTGGFGGSLPPVNGGTG